MKYYSKDILKVINKSNDEFKQLIREELDKSIEEYNKKVPKRRIRICFAISFGRSISLY